MWRRADAVVIGTSMGGIQALSEILPGLPADCPLSVIVVIHLPPERDSQIVSLFRRKCAMRVCEAEDKAPIERGVIYFAPADYHLLIETSLTFSLSSEEPVNFSRPSIDVLFQTAADAYGENVLGIILTGANADGARGLRELSERGGQAVVQSPLEACSPLMPQAALNACPQASVMSLSEIAADLQKLARHP